MTPRTATSFAPTATAVTGGTVQTYPWQGPRQPGARYALAAFVTGTLDPVQTREQFLAYFTKLSTPVMAVVANQAPVASKAEMAAIAALPGVQSIAMEGSLGLAEEYGDTIAAVILPFFNDAVPASDQGA